MRIRPANADDPEILLEIWLHSVRATHHFLTEDDIQFFLPLVANQALKKLEVWVAVDQNDTPLGFMGLRGRKLEMLFIAPAWIRKGGGRLLVEHARKLKGSLKVDVNEQNADAREFYKAMGFVVHGRSEVDTTGRPFPLLHLGDEEGPGIKQ